MDHLASFQSLRRTMERCSEIVSDAYCMKPEELLTFKGELPPGHKTGHRRQMYWVSEEDGDLVVSLPGTTHPLDWSSNMCVHYTPIDGSHPPADTPPEQLEKTPCAHAGFYFRAETIPTLALLEQAAAKGLRLVLTGHSLGAAVANLCTLTALSAQKKAREAAANAACARRASSSAGAADNHATTTTSSTSSSSSSIGGCQPQQQQQQKKAKLSPFKAAAAAAAMAAQEAHHNHSWCSANSDILVSPQAALVDIVCVAFASPHWANQSLADYIEDNDWGEVFVNVVVPEDYCLKLFNNVLTSANPAERHSLSRSSSKASMHDSSSDSQLADDADAAAAAAAAAACGPETLDTCSSGLPAQSYTAAGAGTTPEPSTLENMCSMTYEDKCEDSSTATASAVEEGQPHRYSYQPGGTQQPLVSAFAGTRRKQKKVQLGFDLPDQKAPLPHGTDATAAAADTAAAAAAAAGGADSMALLDTYRPPAVITSCRERDGQQQPGLFATDRGSWSELQGVLPSSPSCASLSSLSSLNSTRSWTLLAYLPDVLMRSFSSNSSNSSNSSSLEDLISPGSSDGGCPHAAADAIAAAIAGAAAASVASPPAAALPLGSSPYSRSSHNTSSSSSIQSSFGLRHAKSSVDLLISSLTDSPRCTQGSSSSSSSSSSSVCLDDSALGVQARGLGGVRAAGATAHLTRTLQQGSGSTGPHRGLRRSATSASLNALTRTSKQLLSPLKISNSLSVVSALLPSLRSIAHASRAVMRTASNVKEAAFNVPLSVFEAGLIKALKPPMYKPVGQQWILSATGLVPQAQPIFMYPKHVHDVYWHKDLALMAFKEHSIVFYKTRLLQQATRR